MDIFLSKWHGIHPQNVPYTPSLEGTKWIETVFQRILLYSATEFAHFGICNGKLKVVGIKDEKRQTKRFLKRWYRRFLPVLPSGDMHVSHFVVDNIVQLD